MGDLLLLLAPRWREPERPIAPIEVTAVGCLRCLALWRYFEDLLLVLSTPSALDTFSAPGVAGKSRFGLPLDLEDLVVTSSGSGEFEATASAPEVSVAVRVLLLPDLDDFFVQSPSAFFVKAGGGDLSWFLDVILSARQPDVFERLAAPGEVKNGAELISDSCASANLSFSLDLLDRDVLDDLITSSGDVRNGAELISDSCASANVIFSLDFLEREVLEDVLASSGVARNGAKLIPDDSCASANLTVSLEVLERGVLDDLLAAASGEIRNGAGLISEYSTADAASLNFALD